LAVAATRLRLGFGESGGNGVRPDHITETEAALRQELSDCYHLFAHLGWTETIFNHITVRVPGLERRYLINPFGLLYDEVTPENLIKVDLDGNPVDPTEHAVNPAGFIIHSAIHRAREDAHCIMHVHTTAGIAVACKKAGLSHDNFYGAQFFGRVAYHDFEGISVHPHEQPRLVKSLGDKDVMILRNHGLLVLGHDIPEAFRWLWSLQRACEVQCQAVAIAGDDIVLADHIRRQSTKDAREFAGGKTARLMFDALVREMRAPRLKPPRRSQG
jgi:ribulose-5-phosphate 4-epimerase/fuculose-1-phosphate aldolase